ncbi:MAG: hypothetical protein PHS17_19855 [Desulfobacterales bacterium]|nr:hypothetical protein [Desulfobacterales bacterium]
MEKERNFKPGADCKERRCLRCGKKVIGRYLCKRCFKLNSALENTIGRYEYHKAPTDLS